MKKENLVQVFSCEFGKIFKNSFFYETPLVAACGKYEYAVNGRFTQGLLQLLFAFFG